MNQKPKAALDTLKKSTELGEKAINTLEEYVNELEQRLQTEHDTQTKVRIFYPKTVEDEYRNKLFVRLMNNFTFTELEHMEKLGKNCFDKNKNYKDH